MILNRLLFKEEFKRIKTLIFRLSILIFLVHSLIMIILYSNRMGATGDDLIYQNETILQILNGIDLYGMFLLFSSIVAIYCFKYLHNNKKVDFYHSLPLRREQLFICKYFIGIIAIIISIIAINVISFSIFSVLFRDIEYISIINLFRSIIYQILASIMIFSFMVLSVVLSNNLGISLIIAGYLPNVVISFFLLVSLLIGNFTRVLISPTKLIYYFTPYSIIMFFAEKIFEFQFENIEIYNNAILNNFELYSVYFMWIIVIYCIAFKIFKNRKSDTSDITVVKSVKYFMYYIFIVISAILFNLLLVTSRGYTNKNIISLIINIIPTLIYIIIISLILNVILNIKFKKKLYNIYSYVICLTLTYAVFSTFYFDIFKLEFYIPKNIKSIYFSSDLVYSSKDLENRNINLENSIIKLDKETSYYNPNEENYSYIVTYNDVIHKSKFITMSKYLEFINSNMDYYLQSIKENISEENNLSFSIDTRLEGKYYNEFFEIWKKDIEESGGIEDVAIRGYMSKGGGMIIISSKHKNTIKFLSEHDTKEG